MQKYDGVLPEDKIFLIFDKYRIYPDKKFLVPLMDILQLRKNENVNYRELLNLLNWKCSLPVLPTIKRKWIIIVISLQFSQKIDQLEKLYNIFWCDN